MKKTIKQKEKSVPTPKKTNDRPNDAALKKKWGKNVIDNGWIAFPNLLIERQQFLGIKPLEMNIILVLLKFWWEKGKNPYPSKTTIAEIVGRDVSTVRKAFQRLEENKLITRDKRFLSKGGQTSNSYDLTNLVRLLKTEAVKAEKLTDERKAEDGKIRRGK